MEDKQGIGQFEILTLGLIGILFLSHLWKMFLAWLDQPKHTFILVIVVAFGLLLILVIIWNKIMTTKKRNRIERSVLERTDDSVFCGMTDDNKEVWLKPHQRAMHTQIVGTTNAGKTESVIVPLAIQDIHAGKGLIIVDGKSERALLDKLWAYTVSAGREKDFRLISLSNLEESHQFNPLIGGSAEEITERIFNSFEFENPHYRSLQYEVMGQVMRIFESAKEVPTFQRLHQVISDPLVLEKLGDKTKDEKLKSWIQYYKLLSTNERDTRTSGLLAAVSHFSNGKTAALFNAGANALTIDEALEKNLIVYFQLPVLLTPFLGKATGKLVLQSLQAAVANRHRSKNNEKGNAKKFFSVFLDDFSEYLYPGFVSILNKSRSANVGIVFAHQALGDITALGDSVANTIQTNSNIKVFMRGNDPDTAEYFSKVIGTTKSVKYTERQKKNYFSTQKSGDVSAREVEEFIVHPNSFKQELGLGEALMVIPHEKGTKTVKIKFQKLDDLPALELPKISHEILSDLETAITRTEKPKVSDQGLGKSVFKNQEAA
jgi:type IV secretory pathway TraG/TraD family ATPase VirD4